MRPGRDRRAVLHPALPGQPQANGERSVVVIGGGIAGLSAATTLAERGVQVHLIEAGDRLGGRVAAWPLPNTADSEPPRTMSRGFHAFFKQYYNLRSMLRRFDPQLEMLTHVADYPLQRPDGMTDSFTGLARTPPWSVMQFVARSPAFTLRSLSKVNIAAAMELVRVEFPETFSDHDDESAADYLDRLRFPEPARALALEVFARSFFADPREFSAGELVAMFHAYFIGSAEGLLFDVPRDDYDTTIWAPWGRHLGSLGVRVQTGVGAESIDVRPDLVMVETTAGELTADALVLATDPRTARELIAVMPSLAAPQAGLDFDLSWRNSVAAGVNAPPFVVLRLWLDRQVDASRPAFIGTADYGPLDNVSVLERFEAGAAQWAARTGGSVVELHAYACPPDVISDPAAAQALADDLLAELFRIFPETAEADELHRELLVADDCTLVPPGRWQSRPGVETPSPRLVLAGDWVRCDLPVALMERAATTGIQASNALLQHWGVAGHDLWTVPMRGLLPRRLRH